MNSITSASETCGYYEFQLRNAAIKAARNAVKTELIKAQRNHVHNEVIKHKKTRVPYGKLSKIL